MRNNTILNVLGCAPTLLNVLVELANESHGIEAFQVLKNNPADSSRYFVPLEKLKVDFVDFYQTPKQLNPEALYALSPVGVISKEQIYKVFKKLVQMEDKQFINLIHPTSYVSRSVKLNYGLQLEPLSTIAACTTIGFAVNIKRNCNIGHHGVIGDFVTINPGVTVSSEVNIGHNTMIGSGSTIRDGITIGAHSIIGMGSVVVKDIPSHSIAYGNPCIVHKVNALNEDKNR